MARMPGTAWVGPHHDNGVMSRFDILCFHTIVGYAPAHAAHFSTRGDGYIYQSRDTAYRSAANLNGNYRVIAVETEDHGSAFGSWSGSNVPAWTAAQVEAHAKIAAWAYQAHGIPLVACPDSRATSRGVAYHRQGIDGNFSGFAYGGRVSGGELWSSSFGKVCPGDRRITQLINQVIPRARQLAGLEAGGDDMSLDDVEKMMWRGGPVTGSVAEDTLIARVNDLEKMVWAGGPVIGSVAPDSLVGTTRAIAAKLDALSIAGVDVAQLAAALKSLLVKDVADELDRRARDNDPNTGPAS